MKVTSMIKLNLLDELKVTFHDEDVTTTLSKRGLGILVYMACNRDRLYYREHLADLFWTDFKKESALSNLRYALWQIRKELKRAGIEEEVLVNHGKNAIKIDCSLLESDYGHFIDHYKAGRWSEAVGWYGCDFLGSFYISDAPNFSDWVFNERERIQRLYFEMQLTLSEHYAQSGSLTAATDCLKSLIKIDPLNELVHYKLMNYHYQSGNKATAINTYRNLKQLLREELNTSPSDEIERLYVRMQTEAVSTSQSPPLTISRKTSSNNKNLKLYVGTHPEDLNYYARKLAKYERTAEQLVFDLCDSPGIRIQYEGLFEILDDMVENGNFNSGRWQKELEPVIRSIRNEPVKDELFFFKQFISLIRGELSCRHVFRIWNFHFLDPKTIDFLSYIFRTETGKEILIVGIYDESWGNERIERFIKAHFTDEHVEIERAET
jgi:DNA-binding SARP family transcriptional activator